MGVSVQRGANLGWGRAGGEEEREKERKRKKKKKKREKERR